MSSGPATRPQRASPPDHQQFSPAPQSTLIGQLLVRDGWITKTQLDYALTLQPIWGSRLGDIVLALGWMRALDFHQVLARHFGLAFVNLIEQPADETLFDLHECTHYAQHLYLPWRLQNGILLLATADPGSTELTQRFERRDDVRFVVTSKLDIAWELQRIAGEHLSRDATSQLAETTPQYSARQVLTTAQKYSAGIGGLILGAWLWFAPLVLLIALSSAVNVWMLVSFLFRTMLCWMSCADQIGLSVSREEVGALADADLPTYSILVPLYKEPTVLPILAAALKRLDYPRSKLDIKLVLEEDDLETINAAKALGLASIFEIIRVPNSLPKTKPKACNYALRFARGRYLTIYDAEDKPDPDQLKKAIVAFRKLGEHTACIQARLNYFNAEENWLTRLFTLEYSLWFDMFLPALDRLQVPIPLGGTSNHFDIEKLREVGAWDPYNVTEDADLGLRFAALGYNVSVVNSVTLEEANAHFGSWIRQRSRWIKGYMQTWLVNMRRPRELTKQVGWKGVASFQLFIGGTIVSGLAYPFLLGAFMVWLVTQTSALHPLFPGPVLAISTTNLVVGNSLLMYLSMLAVGKSGRLRLLPYALTVPFYWLLQSVAAYRALWQLITRPFYWEKTVHGVSAYTRTEVLRATSSVA